MALNDDRYVIHQHVLSGGPYDGFTFGGCIEGMQCSDPDCDRVPRTLNAWVEGVPGFEHGGVYEYEPHASISSTGPFDVWSGSFKWIDNP
jgi:hypothetical protein